jgi:hypothetical protein
MGIVQFFNHFGYSFYEPISTPISCNNPVPGQFCWAPILHIDEIPRVLEVKRDDPRGHRIIDYSCRNMSADDFRGKTRLPLKLLKLRKNQEAIISGASRRPCILLHYGAKIYDDVAKLLPSMGKRHLQREKVMVVLPLFKTENEDDPQGGFPPIMVARIRAMMYDQFFFFPKEKESPLYCDSIGRIDEIQILINNANSCSFEPYKLTDECFAVVLSMVKNWLDLEIDEDAEAIIDICNEAYPEECPNQTAT